MDVHVWVSGLERFVDSPGLAQRYVFQGEGDVLCKVCSRFYEGPCTSVGRGGITGGVQFFVGKPLTSQARPVKCMGDYNVIEIWCILLPKKPKFLSSRKKG